jgi:hypothetical protein
MQGRLFCAGILMLGCFACSADPAAPPAFESTAGSFGMGVMGGTIGAGGTPAVVVTPVGVGGMAGPGQFDFGAPCDPSREVTSESEALLVRDAEILARFPLERVLAQVAATAGAEISGLELMQRLFDTENTKVEAVFPDNFHCDDPNNPAFADGRQRDCPRVEGRLALSQSLLDAQHPDGFVPLALVNRFDLATSNFTTCGEYQIVFGKVSGRSDPADRVLISFQWALSNPAGTLASCRLVAELWADLLETEDVSERADALERFFFEGLDGFLPVVRGETTFSAGRVQVGQGMQAPFQFRQFTLERPAPGPQIAFAPALVAGSLRPELFDSDPLTPNGSAFRYELPGNLRVLKTSDVARMRWLVQPTFEAGESSVDGPSAPSYVARVLASQHGAELLGILAAATDSAEVDGCPADDPLTVLALLRRAAGVSCAGCHAPERVILPEREIGCGMAWPRSLGEAHVDEQGELSPALREVFLPHRARVLSTYLQACNAGAIADYFQYSPPFQGPTPECFPAGTPITLADGRLVSIEQVEPGDWVLTFDRISHALVPAPVERRIVRPQAERLVLINGALLATDNHPFYSNGRWVRADALEVGAPLLSARDIDASSRLELTLEEVPISSLSVQPGGVTTYNLEVAQHHGYFAGGFLVYDRP